MYRLAYEIYFKWCPNSINDPPEILCIATTKTSIIINPRNKEASIYMMIGCDRVKI